MAAKGYVDIRVFGDRELERMLRQLPSYKTQKKVVRPALREAAERIHGYVLDNLRGRILHPKTFRYLSGMAAQRIHAVPRSRYRIGVAFDMPTRAEMWIDPDDKHYYPFALEYGYDYVDKHGNRREMAPKAPIRRAVDDNRDAELHVIAYTIGQRVTREARRLARKGAAA